MSDFQYPASDLDRSRRILSLLGSHWSEIYEGRSQVESFLFAWAQEAKQSVVNLTEAQDSDARQTVPVLHVDHSYRLIIRESDTNTLRSHLLAFGDGAVFGNQPDGTLYTFGVPSGFGKYEYPLPSGLVSIPAIFNKVASPTATLLDGIDYTVDLEREVIVFNRNPFDDERFGVVINLDADSEQSDREVAMWLFRSGWDNRQTYRHWGYMVGPSLDSTFEYRRWVNGVLDGLLEGGTVANIIEIISAVADVPLVNEAQETVEAVFEDQHGLVIATNLTAYRFKSGSTPIVVVGDVLEAGQSMVDTVTFHELNRGVVPDWLMGLALGPEYLSAGYSGGLVFRNEEVPLVVELDVDGKTKVSFELGGEEDTVEQYWDDVHAAGVAADETLANLLDVREDPPTEPTAASLPAAINPLKFLVQNLLRNNTYVVRVKTKYLGDQALDLVHLRQIGRLLPPHTSVIVVAELEPDIEPVMMDSLGSGEPAFGLSSELGIGNPVDMSIDADDISMTAELQYLNVQCGE